MWSFRHTAGLPPRGDPYGGWEAAESGGWPDRDTPTRTLRGHFVGHYLSSLALGFATSGDERLSARADAVVAELRACQRAARSGFVSAWPERVLDELEEGHFSAVWAPWYTVHKILAGLIDVHVHVHAPRAAAPSSGSSSEALAVAHAFCSYLDDRVRRVVARRGEDWWQATLEVEFGGMAEAAYQLHALSPPDSSAAAASLRLARAFSKRSFLEPLAAGADTLAGQHANTHLPLLVSAARGAEVEGREDMLDAPVRAYCLLQLGYAYAGTAGSSVNEHWPGRAASTGGASATSFAPEGIEDLVAGCAQMADAGACERAAPYMDAHCAATCAGRRVARGGGAGAGRDEAGTSVAPADSDAFHTQESCTQYNALKLNAELFSRSPHAALSEAYERKLLNGVLGIQHPRHPGEMVYMMPLGAGVSKERANWAGFGPPDDAFWCCYGTGVESFAKLGDASYFEGTSEGTSAARGDATGPALWVSQFVPSTLRWDAGGARVSLSRELDGEECSEIEVTISLRALGYVGGGGSDASAASSGCFDGGCSLHVRIPSWAESGSSEVRLNGAPLESPRGNGRRLVTGRFLRVDRRWSDGDVLSLRLGLFVYAEPSNDWRPEHARTFALLFGPHMLVGLTEHDEQTLAADPLDASRWARVSRCERRAEGSTGASWAALRLQATGADGRSLTLMLLSEAVEQTYTAYFKLTPHHSSV